MYKKNDVIRAAIDGLGNEGEGVAHIDGFPFFIKDTAPGDVVTAKVMKVKKKLGFARLISVEEASKCRVEPECPVSSSCGGCSLQHISYEAELKYKEEKVYNCLLRIGDIPGDVLKSAGERIVPMDSVSRYRNKAQYPVGVNREGKAIAGFYSGHSHHIVEQDDCALSPPEFKIILRTVLDFIDKRRIPVYDEETGTGLIRHILIRKGFNTGEIMTCIVSASESIPHREMLADELMKIGGIGSVCLNINPDRTNVILGKRTVLLAGKPYIEDILCGLRFRISPLSFYQVNPVMTEKLYEKALSYAGIGENAEIREAWDLCCGIGTITLTAAAKAQKCRIHGIEIVPEAISDAKENAVLNNISNADFTAAPAESYLPEFLDKNPSSSAEAVILDPPRKGAVQKLLQSIAALKPSRVVYISCDPATLARDLKYLLSSGYTLISYQPFDMFPRTGHVETVCLLSKHSTAKEHNLL